MPVTGLNKDSSNLPEWLRNRKPLKDFRLGDVVEVTDVIGYPDDQYGHPTGGGFRVVNFFILAPIVKNGGRNGTLWTFWAIRLETHSIERVIFTELRWYPVV